MYGHQHNFELSHLKKERRR